jgi:catechol 2,3-dioxygenase-like lactoylglutathione lyase family enzyme
VIHGVFHFSYTVSDIERSVAWYTDLLGFELVHRQRQDNEYTRRLVGFPDAVLEVAQLRIRGDELPLSTHLLELVQYVQPRGAQLELATNNVGTAHLALVVTDARGEYDRLAGHGVRFRNPPVEITAGVNRGGFSCYLSDPDGFTLELVQPSEGRLRELGLLSRA